MDALAGALAIAADGFLRYKLIVAMGRLHRERPELTFDRKPLEALALKEGSRYFEYLGLHYNLFDRARLPDNTLLARALREKMLRARSRVYLVLGLLYPWKDISAARWTIEHGDAKARSSAIEYLDNVLAGPFRKRLLPIFEDMSLEERVRRGNSLLNTRIRNVEETLLQLINDDDQVVAASAIHLAAQTGTWSLASDIEYVLEHRDARDWYVFEAASWALAEHRMPAERRRALWLEPLPAVEFASRLSALPLFARTSVDELFRLAGASQQLRHEPGKVLYSEATMPRSVQFLLDGTVTLTARTGESVAATPPAPLAFDEAVQGLPMDQTVRTSDTCVTLALTVEECAHSWPTARPSSRGCSRPSSSTPPSLRGGSWCTARVRPTSRTSRPRASRRSSGSSRCSGSSCSRASPPTSCCSWPTRPAQSASRPATACSWRPIPPPSTSSSPACSRSKPTGSPPSVPTRATPSGSTKRWPASRSHAAEPRWPTARCCASTTTTCSMRWGSAPT
jgi:hypothetical protein